MACLSNLDLLKDKLAAWNEYSYTSEYIKEADQYYYVFFIAYLVFTAYLLGCSPAKYFLYWIVIWQLCLYGKRGYIFYCYNGHYHLLDFCYFVYFVQSWMFIMMYPGSRFWYY
jgi:hypothetical protein